MSLTKSERELLAVFSASQCTHLNRLPTAPLSHVPLFCRQIVRAEPNILCAFTPGSDSLKEIDVDVVECPCAMRVEQPGMDG